MKATYVVYLLLAVVVGTLLFHIWSPWWFTPLSSNWSSIDFAILVTFWVTGFVFLALGGFMVYCVWKYRHQKNRKAEYKPEDKKLEFILALVSAIAVVGLLTPGLSVWSDYIKVPKDASKVEVLSYQWG